MSSPAAIALAIQMYSFCHANKAHLNWKNWIENWERERERERERDESCVCELGYLHLCVNSELENLRVYIYFFIKNAACEMLLQNKIRFYYFSVFIYFKLYCILVTTWIFNRHYSSLQCHMILQKSFWYADLVLKKHLFVLSIINCCTT